MIPVTEFIENGGDLSKVSIYRPDYLQSPDEFNLGYVARNPKNHEDKWYVSKKCFDESLEAAEELPSAKIELRFILKYKARTYGQYFEIIKTTTDIEVLKKLLTSGGINRDGDFESYELIGAEVINQ